MDDNVMRALQKVMAEQADRPFGDVESQSGRTLQPFSVASQQGATNLLSKASRALDDGDLNRAKAFIDRAVRLPYDHHELAAPAARAAHMELFCLVTDTLEECEPGDSRWLDAALVVLSTADDAAGFDLRDVLMAIDQDYELSSRERSRIRSAVAPIPKRAELRDLELSAAELGDQVMSILVACRAYRSRVDVPM
ncbi:hypothetical protein [Nocardioides sp. B-3]|uniref:hypothetical protein n=1 Tax=Nocardioides sp. B-3 TaxID=2895565 RepID=UPI00215300C5|nr:hypothetical protein [Nocardioides sp. B-3]UUZ58265.1 hypothetical protein LP418_18715 [Nocardioides sp. B-3]